MKLSKISFKEADKLGKTTCECNLDTDELSVEEFATLKVLLERSGVLDGHDPMHTDLAGPSSIVIEATTATGRHTAFFDADHIPSDAIDLIEFLREFEPAATGLYHAHPSAFHESGLELR